MPQTHRALPGITREAVNPKTGKPWTLADDEIQAELRQELEAMKEKPELAEQFLKDMGVLTAKGRLSKRYGG